MTYRLQSLLACLAGSLVFAGYATSDVLHLRTGGRLEGIVIRETPTQFTIDIGMGEVSVPRSSVVRVERKESALAEYRARLAALRSGDVPALASLARFAADQGLRSEARASWARVAALDPGNVEAHLALGHVLVGGTYMDEEDAFRARGLVRFDGRWMSPAEQEALLRERELRAQDDRRVDQARREAREAEDRARRAEADAAQARAEAQRRDFYPGYVGPVYVSSWRRGAYGRPCVGWGCPNSHPGRGPLTGPTPSATPQPRVVQRPSSIR